MTDTLWADISEFQVPVTDAYPHRILCIRACDGSYRDHNFAANFAWCQQAVAAGRLAAYIVYYYWRPGGTGAATLQAMCGHPRTRMAVMIDVESGGNPAGNQSAAINAEHARLAAWLGNPRGVIGYGNPGDLSSMWPSRPAGIRLVIAAYGTNPAYPGKLAHQYTSAGTCAPFGACDANSADNTTEAQVLAILGLGPAPPAPKPPAGIPALHCDYLSPSHNNTAPDVRTWQARMAALRYAIAVDGIFGPQTENISLRFQAAKHLATDGLVGPVTWHAAWT